jgi:uncharacterized PurR-regulated membrane protein YhhQ (DUF165 family)
MIRRYGIIVAVSLVYLATIILANTLTNTYGMVPVWPGLEVAAGTYAAGAALLARDFVQRAAYPAYTKNQTRAYLVGLILLGGLLSWATTSNPNLAAASAIAFLGAELVDMGVFTAAWERWTFVTAALLSAVVAAPIDTVLFLWIAGFPVTWESILGQFVGKVLWATLIPLAVWWLIQRWRTRNERRTPATLWDAINRDLGA